MVSHPLLGKLASFSASEAVTALRSLADTPTQRFIAKRDALMDEWWVELVRFLDDHERRIDKVEQELEQLRQRLDDHEALGVLVNFIDDAYREPLDERRRMLAHAAAGIANLKLSIAEYARVWRVLRELDPDDVLVLYGLFLVPYRQPNSKDAKSHGNLVYLLWQKAGAEALVASGCVIISTGGGGAGAGTHEEMTLTSAGHTVLRCLRTYIATRSAAFDVPGHEVTEGFRSEEEAWAMIRAVSGLYEAVLRVARPFSGAIQYSAPNVAAGAPPNGRAQLVVSDMQIRDAQALGQALRPLGIEFGRPVDQIGMSVHGDDEETRTVHVEGPHDVLRVLAYDVDAIWT